MFGAVGKGANLLADRAYGSDAMHALMDARGAWANICAMPQHEIKPELSRFFNKLKYLGFASLCSRTVSTRYDQKDDKDLATVSTHQSGSGSGIMSR